MRFIVVVIVLIAGVWGAAAYTDYTARGRAGPAPPAAVGNPVPPPRTLEERAAAAPGTTLPPESRPPYPQSVAEIAVERADSAAPAGRYRCDGRTRCPEMHSCEEATWVLQNCPGTQMDGDNNGIPCERQWCGRH
jgi:hypothetical protein